MDDLERSLTDLLAGGNRQVALETLLRPARVWLQREMVEGGP
jgi:hypothetical protein